jgi:hypothetical protein
MSKLGNYESRGTNLACEDKELSPTKENLNDPYVLQLVEALSRQQDEIEDFGADFKPLPMAESYYPTRLEYFAGKALQGVVTGRAEKDLKYAAKRALALGKEMDDLFDLEPGDG